MRAQCIDAVQKALGRPVNAAEAKDIENRIRRAMRNVAEADPAAAQAMTVPQRLTEAARLAGEELIAEATLKRVRIAQTVVAHDRIARYLAEQEAKKMGAIDALERTLVFNADGKSNFLSVESRAAAIRANALRQITQIFDQADKTGRALWGLLTDHTGIRDLTFELFGRDTGNAAAKNAAAGWLKVAEDMRRQFNAMGGEIGKLENWALPQHHAQPRVAKAGMDAWVNDVLPLLDRRRYVNEDGSAFSDAQARDFLREAWKTIATDGANKLQPGRPGGTGMRAKRHAESRAIHFAGPEQYLDYQTKYGEKDLYQVMVGHLGAMSRDMALVDTFGPNPDHVFSYFRDQALKGESEAAPRKSGKLREKADKLAGLFDFVAGYHPPVGNEYLAKVFDTLRNWMVSTRLGSAVITSFSDEATLYLTAHVNNLPQFQVFRNELAALNPANKAELRLARRAGLSLDSMISDMNRWGQEALGPSFSKRMAHTTMRLSGLNAMTDARRRAFGITMMDAIGSLTREVEKLKGLSDTDFRILKSKGITETDWQVWRAASPEAWHGQNTTMLTPDAIMKVSDAELQRAGIIPSGQGPQIARAAERARTEAVTKLLGVVLEETDVAVIQPGLKERALMGGGMQRGTWKGELTRSFFLFKSFPIAMMLRHWGRGWGMETAGGKAAYLASLTAATTVLGALSLQVNEVLKGRDPKNLNPFEGKKGVRNWFAAMLKGGSLGIYGDFLFSESTQHGRGPLAALQGPVFGLFEEAFNLTQGNIVQFAQGKDSHAGAELVRFVKSNTPGASLWYAKAALDHMIFHQLQEMASPGYLRTMGNRARREFGQDFWWEPGEFMPSRAPSVAAIAGE